MCVNNCRPLRQRLLPNASTTVVQCVDDCRRMRRIDDFRRMRRWLLPDVSMVVIQCVDDCRPMCRRLSSNVSMTVICCGNCRLCVNRLSSLSIVSAIEQLLSNVLSTVIQCVDDCRPMCYCRLSCQPTVVCCVSN